MRVTYRVEHSTSPSEMSLTYATDQGGTAQEDVRVSRWEKNYTMSRGDFAYISVQNGIDSGTVTCEILLDGRPWKKTTSSGAYVIASCSGSVGRD
ncbi:MAG: hypothetical protein DCC58_20875 [Chloroflexi bacterium]|nr:MAG: hypothetical protein DCC58_20875 [Chloroflexota bacterium]